VPPNSKSISLVLGCVLALVASSGAVRAQQQGLGTLTGRVADATTDKPIAGAMVTAVSPQLQGTQVVHTDSTGTYRVPQLPPGIYTVRFEKEKYQVESLGDIAINADQTVRINTTLTP
jgi:hypothetical protein